jgi:hypothetical protein
MLAFSVDVKKNKTSTKFKKRQQTQKATLKMAENPAFLNAGYMASVDVFCVVFMAGHHSQCLTKRQPPGK